MHDSVIAQSVLNDLKRYGDVKEATLEVGELVGIEPGHLGEHLAQVSRIKFTIVQSEGRVKCECGYEGRPDIIERLHDLVLYECPMCGNDPEAVSGDKIIIKEVRK